MVKLAFLVPACSNVSVSPNLHQQLLSRNMMHSHKTEILEGIAGVDVAGTAEPT